MNIPLQRKCILMQSAVFLFIFLISAAFVAAYPEDIVIDNSATGESAVTARNLNSPLIGTCVCDTIKGYCEANCCCDNDCSSAVKADFSFCAAEQFGYPDITYCTPSNSAVEIRRVNNREVAVDRVKQAQNAICVVRANHPNDLYSYFEVPTSSMMPSSFPVSDWPVNPTSATPSRLTSGQFIPSFRYNPTTGNATFSGYLGVPTQDAYGGCGIVERTIPFLSSATGVSCALKASESCSRLSVSHFANLMISPDLISSRVSVVLNVFNTANAFLGSVSATSTVPASLQSVATATTCQRAVVSASMEITYTSLFLTSATINAVVSDLSLEKYIPFSYSVFFRETSAPAESNIISASPGYTVGSRVRAGYSTTDASTGATTITERATGFSIPAGGRLCSLQNYGRVSFMRNIINSGCLFEMTSAELASMCARGTSSYLNATFGVTDAVGPLQWVVAKTADALTSDPTSWIPIDWSDTRSASTSIGFYDATTRMCSNIITGIQFDFVVARAGVEYNPQDIIVGAFARPIFGSWQIRNLTDFSGSATSLVGMRSRVAFTRYDAGKQSTIRRRVRAPPILPRLDDSVFYPFRKPAAL